METTEADLAALESMWASDDEKEKKKKKTKKINNPKKGNKEEEVHSNVTDTTEVKRNLNADKTESKGDTAQVLKLAEKKKVKKLKEKKEHNLNLKVEKADKSSANDQENSENVTVVTIDTDQSIDAFVQSNGTVNKEENKVDPTDEQTAHTLDGLTAAQKKKLKKKQKEQSKKSLIKEPESNVDSKPRKGIAKLILQQQERLREEQERLEREEAERERLIEEARLAREERERLERERKERRKLKEKERKQRLKDEGKLLTTKQKQDRRRAEQMLEERGLAPPVDGAGPDGEKEEQKEKKKRPIYKKLRRPKTLQSEEEALASSAEPCLQLNDHGTVSDENSPISDNKISEDVANDWDMLADDWEDVDNSDLIIGDYQDESDSSEDEESDDSSSNDEEENVEDDEDHENIKNTEVEKKGLCEVEKKVHCEVVTPIEKVKEKVEPVEEVDPLQRARERLAVRHVECEAARRTTNLRAPIVCVLGHVDTGKTSILDKLRRTHVQDGEAGGITQQIGATNVPMESIRNATRMVKSFQQMESLLPGLLIIDTPGHESFANLRSRGSSLCDIAILVVDIMHGIENQTAESIGLLKKRKTPFVIALNKIDRLYEWRTNPHADVGNILKKQSLITQNEFNQRVQSLVAEFAMHELNVALFNENRNFREYVSMVPTSAHSGDGMGNLMAHVCELSQKLMAKRLSFSEELEAAVMEVKEITGLGTTIDVVLVNGRLREGDQVVLSGQEGPIVTQIRALLMPQPMKELRVKNAYEKFKEIQGAQGVKICAKDLEKALAGLPLYVTRDPFEVEVYKEMVASQLKKALKGIQVGDFGVYVQASTLGSLEALLEFLRTEKIPYCGINIGPVHKRDVMKASVMVERDAQWAVILAFDVKVEREAQEMADTWKPHRIRIFTADIIYHLKDAFLQYREDLKRASRDKLKDVVVFPVKLRIMPQHIFNSRDPIICGVMVEVGQLRLGTPLCVPSKGDLYLGRVTSIEANHKPIERARKGEEVCVKIEGPSGEAPKMYGRHFDHTDLLISRITRDSIDAVKDHFRDEMEKEDWKLVMELKKTLMII